MVSQPAQAIGRIPCGLFVLTAAHDGARSGVLARWVQPCATNPPMVMVALANGLPIATLIRDSRSFALCQISSDDRFLHKIFETAPDPGFDPFVTLPTATAPSGSPIIGRALAYLDCKLARRVDLESDFGLYIGHVRASGVLNTGRPAVLIGGDRLVA